jgi:2-polyprenyl-3-methyl-5-hydroxy-6-metoxy-1,4-benzoquinol methylase
MDRVQIEQRRREIVERFGPWSAHNIRLAEDIYTIGSEIVGDEIKLRRILRTVADVAGRPLATLRILDLACLEGMYAVEFARHGATVVGIEGREQNLAKARFAKDVLALPNLEFVHDDVRNLARVKHGEFDVVLCLGILYHLDAPDVFVFLERMADVCCGFAVIDTHIATSAARSCVYRGRTYRGRTFAEHDPASTPADRAADLWSSLDNVDSFWPTRASLLNALTHAGFTSIYECAMPPEPAKPADRITLVAARGRPLALLGSPQLDAQPVGVLPE